MIELIAIKKCGENQPGERFFEKPGRAKLLIATKLARKYDIEQTYQTRNMTATEPAQHIVVDEVKRGRGRPRKLVA